MSKILRWLLRFFTAREILRQQYAVGMTSYIDKDNDRHLLFLDYDNMDFGEVFQDSKELAEFWCLSDFELYRTNNGIHVFYFYDNSLPYSRVRMIIEYSRCDPMFKYLRKRYDYATIRASGKYKVSDIKFLGRFSGSRIATKCERELGSLKRAEYLTLQKQKFFVDEVLTDNKKHDEVL